ncbi:MAG: hypothetical protein HY318_09095 [Armatimonadetes bacterium]|nr:hypothetical protein [Armatimonadota bacterium]
MFAVLEQKRQYIESATVALQEELSNSIQLSLLAVEVKSLVDDCVRLIDDAYALDFEMHEHAIDFSSEEWERQYRPLDSLFQELPAIARRVISLAEKIARTGESVEFTNLHAKLVQVEKDLNWPDDYGATAKYRALAEEVHRDYLAGNVIEGGWE